jgi:hypothetical protein
MDIYKRKHKHDLYYGAISYSIGNCKNAFRYLKKTNDELNECWRSGRTDNINELGQHDRVFKDYLILKVAGLFDKHNDALSLITFKSFLEKAFPEFYKQFSTGLDKINFEYKDTISKIIQSRHKIVAHSDKDGFDNLIHTQDLLEMPIPNLLKDVENLLASVSNPTFPV